MDTNLPSPNRTSSSNVSGSIVSGILSTILSVGAVAWVIGGAAGIATAQTSSAKAEVAEVVYSDLNLSTQDGARAAAPNRYRGPRGLRRAPCAARSCRARPPSMTAASPPTAQSAIDSARIADGCARSIVRRRRDAPRRTLSFPWRLSRLDARTAGFPVPIRFPGKSAGFSRPAPDHLRRDFAGLPC